MNCDVWEIDSRERGLNHLHRIVVQVIAGRGHVTLFIANGHSLSAFGADFMQVSHCCSNQFRFRQPTLTDFISPQLCAIIYPCQAPQVGPPVSARAVGGDT